MKENVEGTVQRGIPSSTGAEQLCILLFFLVFLQEILTIICARLVYKVPMFRSFNVNFINAILTNFQHEVFQEGDFIIRQSAPGDRMFFIEHGQVLEETESSQRELCDGDYFGGGFMCSK